jgi:hypothetical protein
MLMAFAWPFADQQNVFSRRQARHAIPPFCLPIAESLNSKARETVLDAHWARATAALAAAARHSVICSRFRLSDLRSINIPPGRSRHLSAAH